ncbi:LysR family transcriptional regulator [Lichenihabitans sp. PAMC28606]|uniref:LysR family transcriptional regulator n=1 Tax=Lichenihabitans sp. PAMC28606 TaxID=2880932 RepID=UPI001D0B4458|nr:LysR family transcriptional regulator [Lichenihabitans sp. PAMC28606]UDL92993.1 LysR family transcriptional regulator [Lichenihabitans sp. PAMC28606]
MTLEQLRIFIAVASREHVTQAAGELNLTQSAVSAAVAALEERYATKLFDRVGRRIALTDAGRLFLIEARAVLARAKAAELVLSDLAGLKRGSLALAASQTIGNYWLPEKMQLFRKAHPGVDLHLTIDNTARVATMVRDGTVDLGFVEGEVDDPAFASRAVADDELIMVVGPRHPWASRRSIAPQDLIDTGWVLREPGSGTRSRFEEALRGFGVDPDRLTVRLELPSNEAVRTAIETGPEASVLSRLVAALALRAGTLAEVRFALPRRHFTMLRHKERSITAAETALMKVAAADAPRRGADYAI